MSACPASIFTASGSVYRQRYHRCLRAFEDADTLEHARIWIDDLFAALTAERPFNMQEQGGERAAEVQEFLGAGSLVASHAPVALIEGAWLQAINQPASSHQPAVCELFAGYRILLGSDAGQSPAHGYRGLLARNGVMMASTLSALFAEDTRAGDLAFAFGALQLALALVGRERFDELLGFSLGYSESHESWRLVGVSAAERHQRLRRFRSCALRAYEARMASLSGALRVEAETRCALGRVLYHTAEKEYGRSLRAEPSEPGLVKRVAAIIGRKAQIGAGYHAGKELGGCPLNRWFAAQPFDARNFLRAFAESAWTQGDSGKRPFDRLVTFGGPMFGVFSAEEWGCIEHWLDVGAQVSALDVDSPMADGTVDHRGGESRSSEAVRWSKWDRRVLFHRLVNGADDAQTLASAQAYVTDTLVRARRRITRRGPMPQRFFDYSPGALRERVADWHRAAADRLGAAGVSRPQLSRDEYRWGIRQFAPAVLVDGSWLAGISQSAQQDDPVYRRLGDIYADELGAGRPERHHPAIYRKLLDELAIDLPPLETVAFAQSRELLEGAFDLPVFFLAIGRLPRSFFPEILGLNLAVELSGLGAQYGRLADELEYWGIDPLIVRLHQSIDNLASGHSALALEAIEIYLENVECRSGPVVMTQDWRRIWSGYVSLLTVTRRFRWTLAAGFCAEFGWGRIRQFFDPSRRQGFGPPARL